MKRGKSGGGEADGRPAAGDGGSIEEMGTLMNADFGLVFGSTERALPASLILGTIPLLAIKSIFLVQSDSGNVITVYL